MTVRFLADGPGTGGLTPDDDTARRWLTDELSKSRYDTRPGLLERIGQTIEHWLRNLVGSITHASNPLPAVVAAVVAVLLVALGVYLLRHVRRTPRATPGSSATVLGTEALDADGFRDRARQALARGDTDRCALEAMRAIARRGQERNLLVDAPSRTAHEVAAGLAQPFPHSTDELRWAASVFDVVAYGHGHASLEQAQLILALETELSRARPHPLESRDVSVGQGFP